MKKTNKLPKALKNVNKSKWLESAKWDIENEEWLDLSFEIALRVYSCLSELGKTQRWLADELDCSPQYVGKILKGKENLTLQTIIKLEKALNIHLITLASSTQLIRLELDIKPNVPNIGNITMRSDTQPIAA